MIEVRLKLREALEARPHISQAQLAEETGLRKATISEMVNNSRSTINREHVGRVCAVLGITDPSEIFRFVYIQEMPAQDGPIIDPSLLMQRPAKTPPTAEPTETKQRKRMEEPVAAVVVETPAPAEEPKPKRKYTKRVKPAPETVPADIAPSVLEPEPSAEPVREPSASEAPTPPSPETPTTTEPSKGQERPPRDPNYKPVGRVWMVPMQNIVIPDKFSDHPPKPEKIAEARAYYEKHRRFDKPLLVDHTSDVLINGYARYIMALEIGLTAVPVIYKIFNTPHEK